jgi:YVTN family beta-propeller protein
MTRSTFLMDTGSVLGGYRIDDVAGRGGMGVVYRATQLGLDRVVALKVIARELADDLDFRSRFKSEAQLAASIDHPNVVPIYEAGEADDVLYLAMRYVEGTDLRALVEGEGGLPPERAVRLIWQVAAALDAAHRRGLVHRDVKPPNVLIAQEGEEHAYLTDFGLTKHAGTASGFTRTGLFVGTPDFAAPEQIRGEHADARVDVYALGCLLFHALTARTPFPRDSELAKMYAHLNDPAPAAGELAHAVPPALDGVISTAMAKNPAERYASAGDLARAAWAALTGDAAPAPAGSVATGDAAAQSPPVPETPAPRTPAPAAISTPPPGGTSPSLAAAAAHSHPSEAPATRRPSGPAGWPRGRRIALLIALPGLLIIALGVAALGAAGMLAGADEPAAPSKRRPAAAPPAAPVQAKVVQTLKTKDGPDGITVDGKSVFVSHAKDGTLIKINSETDQIVGEPVPVGKNPDQIAAGKGTVWVVDASDDKVQRLQSAPTLQATATIPVGTDAQAISLGVQLAWVANTGDDTVQRIDRAQAQTVGDPIGVGDAPLGIHVGSKVWVTSFRDGTLSKIDIATAQVEGAPLPTGAGARGVTEGFGGVWVSNAKDNTVTRVDPETFKVVAQIPVGEEPKELIAALGSVWVVNSKSNTVTRIDPRTNRVSGAAIPVGRNPLGIAATERALWVTNFADDTLSVIKP